MASNHHGPDHGIKVIRGALKLAEKLTESEKSALIEEGEKIIQSNLIQTDSSKNNCSISPFDAALACVCISAFLHDCGRFNDQGIAHIEEQNFHPKRSAKRAKVLCESLGFSFAWPFIEDAILSHDFQNLKLTPVYKQPETMIARLVQAADQMCWFHPKSIHRAYNMTKDPKLKGFSKPFLDVTATFEERMAWIPHNNAPDIITVFLGQLFGPCDTERFGIAAAREKIESYKEGLKENILKLSEENGVKPQVAEIIKQFEEKHK